MKLRYSPTSPYVRKVMVTAMELGVDGKIECIDTNPWQYDSDLVRDNPLGKVPALTTDDGEVLYDSPVVCEYLDHVYGQGRLFPSPGPARWRVLRQQALCDGILDAAVLRRLESQRPVERRSEDWAILQRDAVERGVDALEQDAAGWDAELTIAQISAACALGYLDFRFSGEDWRTGHPTVAQWYEGFAQRPSMQATRLHG
jgi:glutathione S-transferase